MEAKKKVFVSGCYDMLHSGHVAFFKEASHYGDLYVGIGSDQTILGYKGRLPVYSESERLYMVKAIRYVKEAYVNTNSGIMDFVDLVDNVVKPDVFVVNEDGDSDVKAQFCRERGIEYIVLKRLPDSGLKARSTTALRQEMSQLPTRIDLAGTWIDQPYVSCHAPGWALTVSLEPNFEIAERCGLSTSTRNMMKKIWPVQLPSFNPEMVAKLAFCFENDPSKRDGHISGAQDALGICMPGLCRHYYNNAFWPERLESCHDEEVLAWLESHLCMVKMFPRRPGLDVTLGKEIFKAGVERLASAADGCWNAIMTRSLNDFAYYFRASFDAQVAMFPAMMQPGVEEYISRYRAEALAWKMAGAGGGGMLILVVDDAETFAARHPEAIRINIRRKGA